MLKQYALNVLIWQFVKLGISGRDKIWFILLEVICDFSKRIAYYFASAFIGLGK